jgi:tetratricopeptide (TPR) repeat protein
MKRTLFLFGLIFAAGILYGSENPLAQFNAAVDAYKKGEFRQAIAQYEAFAAEHGANAALYYNLGNACYRDGQIGRALVNFERARRLAPHDADICANRDFVRQQVKEPEPPLSDRISEMLCGIASLNTMLALCSALYIFLIAGSIAWFFTRRRPLIIVNAALVMAGVVAAALLYVKIDREVLTHSAVVISGPADVRNGPGGDSSIGFTLPEGRTVTVLGGNGEWAAIGLPSEGLRGWIEKKNIELL